MKTCVNLLETFSDRYRITFDPAYDPRHVPRRCLDPWMMQIPCRGKGITIYPHGGNTLAVEVDYHRGIARQVAATKGVRLHQDGDQEKTFLFDLSLFDQVAAIVRPKRRMALSPEERQRRQERMARVRSRSL